MEKNASVEAADFIATLRFSGEQTEKIPDPWQPQDLESGYEIQAALVEKLIEKEAATAVGYKVACTNKLAQELLHVESPFYGFLLSSRVYASPARLRADAFSMRCMEAEFAFEMGHDLPARSSEYTRAEVLEAVRNFLPSIEIVDTRFTDWTGVGAPTLIADNACNGAWIQGASSSSKWRDLDLAAHLVKLNVNGKTRMTGNGAAVLGHPLNSLRWLANKLREQGHGLKAGDLITTGVCTDVYFAEPGDHIIADFGVLGSVELSFS